MHISLLDFLLRSDAFLKGEIPEIIAGRYKVYLPHFHWLYMLFVSGLCMGRYAFTLLSALKLFLVVSLKLKLKTSLFLFMHILNLLIGGEEHQSCVCCRAAVVTPE